MNYYLIRRYEKSYTRFAGLSQPLVKSKSKILFMNLTLEEANIILLNFDNSKDYIYKIENQICPKT